MNIEKHGVDFNDAIAVFLDEHRIEWQDERKAYGERRYVTIGAIENIVYTIVYTPRHQVYRMISARGASRNEREAYDRHLKTDAST